MEYGNIIEICADGYERTAVLNCTGNIKNVHFLEYDEYFSGGDRHLKRQIGDVLKGRAYIGNICTDRITEEGLMHFQPFKMSPHINAVVEVVGIIDRYTAYVRTTVSEDIIQAEFEHIIPYNAGDKIYIEGSLELDVLQN